MMKLGMIIHHYKKVFYINRKKLFRGKNLAKFVTKNFKILVMKGSILKFVTYIAGKMLVIKYDNGLV